MVCCRTLLLTYLLKVRQNDALTRNIGPSGHVNKCALSALANEEHGVKGRCEGCQFKALQKVSTVRILKKTTKKNKRLD